jgi:hypothetical protein
MSKLAAQMVTSTSLENLSLHLYESQNKNLNFGTAKTLILDARSIFFKRGHLTKIESKKIFFMKTLSKLGALTVLTNFKNANWNPPQNYLLCDWPMSSCAELSLAAGKMRQN